MTQYLSQKALFSLLLTSFPMGFCLSAFYDLFRIRRRLIPGPSGFVAGLWTAIEDVIFFLCAGVCTVLMFYLLNNGQVRVLGLVGLIPGFFLWRLTFSRLLFLAVDGLLRLIRSLGRFLYQKILLPPVRFFARAAASQIHRITAFLDESRRRRNTRRICRRAIRDASLGFGEERKWIRNEKKRKPSD